MNTTSSEMTKKIALFPPRPKTRKFRLENFDFFSANNYLELLQKIPTATTSIQGLAYNAHVLSLRGLFVMLSPSCSLRHALFVMPSSSVLDVLFSLFRKMSPLIKS